jgi:hypothetical protein
MAIVTRVFPAAASAINLMLARRLKSLLAKGSIIFWCILVKQPMMSQQTLLRSFNRIGIHYTIKVEGRKISSRCLLIQSDIDFTRKRYSRPTFAVTNRPLSLNKTHC